MILKAVQALLFKYNCVIIPGFGGVITNYRSAEIHPVKNTFTPPKKRLAFNENLIESDGLLVNYIASSNGVAMDEAEQMVLNFVKDIKNKMEQEGNVMLDHIGMFSYNSEKRIQFKPLITENYLEDSFGLPDLYFKPIERKESTVMEEVHASPQSPVPNRGPVKKEKKEEETSKKSNPLFLIIPIVLVLVTLGSMFVVKDQQGDVLMASLIPSLKSDMTEGEMSDEEDVDSEDDSDAYADEEVESEDVHDDEWHDAHDEGDFHVIAGVFSKRSYAQRLADKFHGDVLEMDGYFKVSVARSSTKADADQQKSDLVSELGNDIWILEQ